MRRLAFQQRHYLPQTRSNEKEIHVPIRILQTPRRNWRFALFRSDYACSVCAAPNTLWAIRSVSSQTTACSRAIPGCHAGNEVRYLATVAQHQAATVEGMHTAR